MYTDPIGCPVLFILLGFLKLMFTFLQSFQQAIGLEPAGFTHVSVNQRRVAPWGMSLPILLEMAIQYRNPT